MGLDRSKEKTIKMVSGQHVIEVPESLVPVKRARGYKIEDEASNKKSKANSAGGDE